MDLLIKNYNKLSRAFRTQNVNTLKFFKNNFIESEKEQMVSNCDPLVICEEENTISTIEMQNDYYSNISISSKISNSILFPNDDIYSGRVSALTDPLAYTGTSFNLSSENGDPQIINYIDLATDINTTLQPHLSEVNNGEVEFTLSTVVIPTTGIALYVLSLLTFVGNAMVLHAIRTDKRLQTVRRQNIKLTFLGYACVR